MTEVMREKHLSLPGISAPTKATSGIPPGKRFGRLMVIRASGKQKYLCQCDCKNIHKVLKKNLISGNTRSCGCLNKTAAKKRNEVSSICLIGRQFGEQKVIRENGRNKGGEILWLLRCECGREVSRVGRFLLKNPNAKRCPCQKGKKNVPQKDIRKPRNEEQFAWDIYCMYIKQGWKLREIAIEEGFSRGAAITILLMSHVPEYKEQSIQRREKSKDNEQNKKRKKLSRLYHFEKDFQAECVKRLCDAGIPCTENDKLLTGYEIDIRTNRYCLELKTRVAKKDIYRAMGQLQINASRSNLRPGLVIPSDVELDNGLAKELTECGVKIFTEKDAGITIT